MKTMVDITCSIIQCVEIVMNRNVVKLLLFLFAKDRRFV